MHFYVILKSLPISDDRGPSSFEGTSTVLRLKFMYVSSFDSINIRTHPYNPHTPPTHTHTHTVCYSHFVVESKHSFENRP